jgi:hypothetical protein
MISGGPSALRQIVEDGVARRSWKFALGVLVAGATGSAAAQDFTAGKTPAQLFQSDCSACHKSPQGLSRGMDQRSLVGFLREHYTTKQESAGVLAAYVAGAGGGAQRPAAAGAGQNPRPSAGITEGEPGQKPGQRPRANAASAPEPRPSAGEAAKPRPPRVVTAPTGPAAQTPDDEGETAIMREESARRAARTPPREGARPAGIPVDPTAAKLKSYGEAGGSARETERLADPVKKSESKVESYANTGSPVPAVTPQAVTPEAATPQVGAPQVATPEAGTPQAAKDAPAGGDVTNSVTVPAADTASPPAETATVPAADAANPPPPVEAASPPPKRKKSKKDAAGTPASPADSAAPAAAHSPRLPRRAAAPIIRPLPGNN